MDTFKEVTIIVISVKMSTKQNNNDYKRWHFINLSPLINLKGLIKISKKYLGKHNGFHIVEFDPRDLDIIYYDKPKLNAPYSTYFNAGFFSYFAERVNNVKVNFTLPVANLVANIDIGIPALGKKYLEEWTKKKVADKVILSCNQNPSAEFKNKDIATLIVDRYNRVEIKDVNTLDNNVRVAVSGVPVIKLGDDVDWYRYVSKQWSSGVMYATYRNFLAIKNQKIYLISGKTATSNYIYGMYFWNRMKDMAFESCISMDGGGSHVFKYNNSIVSSTFGNRSINNIGVIN